MAMTMTLKHLQKTPSGKWQYRRRWPTALSAVVTKAPFKKILQAQSEAELLREYPKVDAEYHRQVKALMTKDTSEAHNLSPREAYQVAQRHAEEIMAGVRGLDDDSFGRGVVADSLRDRQADPLVIRAVLAPNAPPPGHSLRDALNIYLRDRHGNGEGAPGNREAKVRVERMFKRVAEALGDRFSSPLTDLRREDARNVVAYMLDSEKLGGGKLSPASVKREVNQIKAVISYALP